MIFLLFFFGHHTQKGTWPLLLRGATSAGKHSACAGVGVDQDPSIQEDALVKETSALAPLLTKPRGTGIHVQLSANDLTGGPGGSIWYYNRLRWTRKTFHFPLRALEALEERRRFWRRPPADSVRHSPSWGGASGS
jgi:hypothetical protein